VSVAELVSVEVCVVLRLELSVAVVVSLEDSVREAITSVPVLESLSDTAQATVAEGTSGDKRGGNPPWSASLPVAVSESDI
jgi:hypothetical protein